MLKILHTADWHLGKKLENFDRTPEQVEVMDEICRIADEEEVDIVLIAGDLYDSFNPPIAAVELFYGTLRRLSKGGLRPVFAIAGNHDSPDRVEAPDPLARISGIFLTGYPHSCMKELVLDSGVQLCNTQAGYSEFKFPGKAEYLKLIHTPYANELRLKKDMGVEDPEASLRQVLNTSWTEHVPESKDDNALLVLMTHLFFMKHGGERPEEPDDERPINVGGAQTIYTSDIPKEVQYTALGHLHRNQVIDKTHGPVVYSGSPLSYSFAEASQEKAIMILEYTSGEALKTRAVPLSKGYPLIRKTFEDMEEALGWLQTNQECFVELSIKTDSYIPAEDRKRLADAHDRMIGPIPILTKDGNSSHTTATQINLSQSPEELFREYYLFKKSLEPGKTIMDLFLEVKALKES